MNCEANHCGNCFPVIDMIAVYFLPSQCTKRHRGEPLCRSHFCYRAGATLVAVRTGGLTCTTYSSSSAKAWVADTSCGRFAPPTTTTRAKHTRTTTPTSRSWRSTNETIPPAHIRRRRHIEPFGRLEGMHIAVEYYRH